MKVNWKNYVSGVLTGVLAMYTIPTLAQQITKSIEVSYRNIKIYADGNLVNTNGDNEAFIYNGTTYLPVRAVGEAFNKAVNWNGQTNSVYIGTTPTNTSQPTVLLENLDYFTKTLALKDIGEDLKDNVGNLHSSGVIVGNEGAVEYLLNGKYNKFSGTIGLPYSRRDFNKDTVIKIYGDGKLLYTSPIMKGGVVPNKFNIDVSGVLNLKIEKSGTGIADYRWCCIYDAGFYA